MQNMVDKIDKKPDKYVCPSDRQLCLRAKLQTGWSCGKAEPLKPEEQQKILEVIRRNELIETAERQRVGKLVDRVEKIKQLAVESGPRNCRLCGQAFGMLGPSKLICDDCCKPVCSKCSIELSSKSDKKKETWLCKICSETREMWKKTGAWFFHGLPQYELPQKQLKKPIKQQEPPPRVIKTTKLGMQIDESSEEDDEDDLLNENSSPFTNSRNQTRHCRNFFGLRLPNENSNSRANYNYDDNNMVGKSPNSSTDSQKSASSSGNQHDWEVLSVNNRLQHQLTHGARKSSVSSSWSISESSSVGLNEMMGFNRGYRDPVLGWLEIVLIYEESTYVVQCTISRARDLPAMDSAGLADPFCKLNIITQEGNLRQKKWEKTKTVHKTKNPEFNDTIKFCGISPEDLGSLALYVVLLDDDKYGHDFLGCTKILLSPIYNCSPCRMTIPLGPDDDDFCHDAMTSGPWPNGKVLISLSYNTKRRALMVLIKECKDLTAMDKNGFSDPFIKLQIKPDSHRKKQKTSIKWRTLNPIYNEEFAFETRPNDLDKQSLIITVWDKDIGKSNDFLGSLIIGPNSKGRRLKQWKNTVLVPDHHHEEWHCLSQDLPKHH